MDRTNDRFTQNPKLATRVVDLGKVPTMFLIMKVRFLLIAIALILLTLIALSAGMRHGSPENIAVDNEKRLFLSYSRCLCVVSQNKICIISKFSEPIDDMAVSEDNFLCVKSGAQVHWFDLSRSDLEQKFLMSTTAPASTKDTPIGAHSEMVLPDEQNGITYSLSYKDNWFRYKIYSSCETSGDQVFFIMPLVDLLVDCLMFILYAALIVCVIALLLYQNSRAKKTNSIA